MAEPPACPLYCVGKKALYLLLRDGD